MAFFSILIGFLLLYIGFRVWGQPLDKDRVSYWQTTVQGLDEDPDVFFAQVFQALKEGLASRDVQLSGMGFGPTKLFETRSIFSSRPLYLEARYKHLSYYLYLGQTPTGLFLSSRSYNKFVKGEGGKGILSYAALKYFQRQTMFQYDAAIIFQESVHAIVLQVLDGYIQEKKLKPLKEYERRPILHAFYANAYPPRPQQVWSVPMPTSIGELANPPRTVDATIPANSVAPKVLPLEADEFTFVPIDKPQTAKEKGQQQVTHAMKQSSIRFETTFETAGTAEVGKNIAVASSDRRPSREETVEDQVAIVSQDTVMQETESEPEASNTAPPRNGRTLPL